MAFLLISTGVVNASISLGFGASTQMGSSVSIGIEIAGLVSDKDNGWPALSTYDLNIEFDNSHLKFSSVTYGDPVLGNQLDVFDFGDNDTEFLMSSPGVLNLYEISLDAPEDLNEEQADDFTLATLTFQALKQDSSQLSLIVNDLGDAAGELLTANLVTGNVTTVPVPAAFWMMVCGLAVLSRKKV